jgi:hypothetical protein
MKKFLFGLTPLLAVAAFAVVPAAAQAQRVHACWENTAGGPCITKTETIHSRSDVVAGVSQPLVLKDIQAGSAFLGVTVSCIDTDEGTVGTGGKDSITKTIFSSCTTNAPGCTVKVEQSSLPWETQAEKEGAAFFDTITILAKGLVITFMGTGCPALTASGSVSQTWANRGSTEAGDSTFTKATGLTLSNGDATEVNGTIEIARSFGPPLSKIFMS